MVTAIKTYSDKTKPYVTLYNLGTGEEVNTKITNEASYISSPFKLYSIINVMRWKEQYKKKKVFENGKYQYKNTDEIINIPEEWIVIK